ncbi:MAG: hypothetical protein A3G75_03045 [Verrucomicrobia bacterium RIFCSPLOWO2_12_FULL_64_8]|nr:MAG: hypothetical protein A3G75_03045 [Verrucomicrobia bacterium RIFCSPLOWO2_12_FULL_64_8]
MNHRMVCALVAALGVATTALVAASAKPVTKKEVLTAIEVLEKDPFGDRAATAARVVARFGEESEEVFLYLSDDTLPWMSDDVPPAQAEARALLMAVYFAGNIKAQLERKRVEDDPYSGWLLAIKTYREMRKRQAQIRIPEIEELMELERAGRLKAHAETIQQKQEEQSRRERMI